MAAVDNRMIIRTISTNAIIFLTITTVVLLWIGIGGVLDDIKVKNMCTQAVSAERIDQR